MHFFLRLFFWGALALEPLAGYAAQDAKPIPSFDSSENREVKKAVALPDAPGEEATDRSGTSASGGPETTSDQKKDGPPASNAARIGGTVTDTNGDIVPGATVALDGASASDRQTVVANESGSFEFDGLKPGVLYFVTIQAKGFADWKSGGLRLHSGEVQFVTGIQLHLLGQDTTVMVTGSQEQIATQQVHIEEEQRVLGFIPNFYVVYDSKNAVAMTTKLKFQMALRVSIDPITFAGAAFLAGIEQAADTPDYVEGARGYGERFGAVYTDGFTDAMFGGAILPSLLHQDPRYFYMGTGSIKARTLHALAAPFICKGDNGRWQPNYSSIGGDLISSSISNAYYPPSSRGPGITFENVATSTAERAVSTLIQEFVVRKLTPSAKRQP
jgi:hypothetical protein